MFLFRLPHTKLRSVRTSKLQKLRKEWQAGHVLSTELALPAMLSIAVRVETKTHVGYLLWSPKYVKLVLSVSESTQRGQYGGGMLSTYVQDTSQQRTWSQVKPQPHQLKGDIFQMVERRKLLHRGKTKTRTVRRHQQKGNVETLGCRRVTSMAQIGH